MEGNTLDGIYSWDFINYYQNTKNYKKIKSE